MLVQNDSSSTNNLMLFSMIGGAVLGAVAVALTTPKTGREVRGTLKSAARRLRGRLEEPEDLDTGTIDALFI
jgi:gas vesicle protein